MKQDIYTYKLLQTYTYMQYCTSPTEQRCTLMMSHVRVYTVEVNETNKHYRVTFLTLVETRFCFVLLVFYIISVLQAFQSLQPFSYTINRGQFSVFMLTSTTVSYKYVATSLKITVGGSISQQRTQLTMSLSGERLNNIQYPPRIVLCGGFP